MSGHAGLGQSATPLLLQIDGSATDGFYLGGGGRARLKEGERTALGEPLIVCDREGRCSLHEVIGIHRLGGVRTVQFGPQVEWPQGGTELRQIKNYIDAPLLGETA